MKSENYQPTEGNNHKTKAKKKFSRLIQFAEISLQQLKMVLSSVAHLGNAPSRRVDGGSPLKNLDQGIMELLDSLRYNLVVSDGWKSNVWGSAFQALIE